MARRDLRLAEGARGAARPGWKVSEKTVADSMARQGLVARPKRGSQPHPPRQGRRSDRGPGPSRVHAEQADEKWCGDLTEIPTDEGKLYLASVLDLAARRIPGFAIGEHHDADLATGALQMAAAIRGGDVRGVIFHSDKGSEYTASHFEEAAHASG